MGICNVLQVSIHDTVITGGAARPARLWRACASPIHNWKPAIPMMLRNISRRCAIFGAMIHRVFSRRKALSARAILIFFLLKWNIQREKLFGLASAPWVFDQWTAPKLPWPLNPGDTPKRSMVGYGFARVGIRIGVFPRPRGNTWKYPETWYHKSGLDDFQGEMQFWILLLDIEPWELFCKLESSSAGLTMSLTRVVLLFTSLSLSTWYVLSNSVTGWDPMSFLSIFQFFWVSPDGFFFPYCQRTPNIIQYHLLLVSN